MARFERRARHVAGVVVDGRIVVGGVLLRNLSLRQVTFGRSQLCGANHGRRLFPTVASERAKTPSDLQPASSFTSSPAAIVTLQDQRRLPRWRPSAPPSDWLREHSSYDPTLRPAVPFRLPSEAMPLRGDDPPASLGPKPKKLRRT